MTGPIKWRHYGHIIPNTVGEHYPNPNPNNTSDRVPVAELDSPVDFLQHVQPQWTSETEYM
jgi:hypothetical protein